MTMLVVLLILHYLLRVQVYSGCDADASLPTEECDPCPENCISCDGTENCTKCKEGFFGAVCSHKCPVNCLKCSSTDKCISCKYGFSGNTCGTKCSENCVRYNRSTSGHFGHIRLANGEDVWCFEDGTCKDGCIAGKYGGNCSKDCPNTDLCHACSQFTGHCKKCMNGTYGKKSYCNKKCGHCKPDNKGEVKCDIDTGSCIGGCSDGYYSSKCDQKCGECMLPVKCNSKTGFCENDCVDGYFGQHCNRTCERCRPNYNQSTVDKVRCDKSSGICTFGCISGFYGESCEKRCSVRCKSSLCTIKDGHCVIGCIPGWYGNSCNKTCNVNCKNRSCTKKFGNCNEGCIPGWYGDTSNKTCSDNCRNKSCTETHGHCNTTCNVNCRNRSSTQKFRYCNEGCNPGWYGDNCNNTCSDNCTNKSCTQTHGHCDNGCIIGKYGHTCNDICSSTCSNKSCDQNSGDCDKGCVHQWYGFRCGRKCSSTCINRSCDSYTGFCVEGCKPGYFGDMCEISHPESCKDSVPICSNTFVVGFTGGLIGAAIVLISLLVRWIVKKSLPLRRKRYGELDNSTRANVMPIYEEIDENIERSEQPGTAANHFYMEVASLHRTTQVSEANSQCNYEVADKKLNVTSDEGTHTNSVVVDLTMSDSNEHDLIMVEENSILNSNSATEIDHQQSASKNSRNYYNIPDISTNNFHGFKVVDRQAYHIYDYPPRGKNKFCWIGQGMKAISADRLQYVCNMSSFDSGISRKCNRSLSDSGRKNYDNGYKTNALATRKLMKDEKNNGTLRQNKPQEINEIHAHAYYVNINLENNTNTRDVLYQNIYFDQTSTEITRNSHENETLTMKTAEESESDTIHCSSYINMESFQTQSINESETDFDTDYVNYLHPIS